LFSNVGNREQPASSSSGLEHSPSLALSKESATEDWGSWFESSLAGQIRTAIMTTFFSSDTHFGHANVIRYCNRPFEDVRAMDESLIRNWNSVVQPGDTIYHLGDFGFYRADEEYAKVLRRLNGNKVFIFGNHDKQIRKNISLQKMFSSCHPILETKVKLDDETFDLTLCHYAMRVWNKSHRGAIHLYGHSHGSLPDDPNSLSMDVGVDCHNYTPVSFEEVMVRMTKKAFRNIDHHGKVD
jgi:calcineurin-like phosphoesterase family protein